jgi:hypothetical protein
LTSAVRPEQNAARWEAILSALPAWVEAYVHDLRRLLASRQMGTVKLGLAKLVKEIVVEPQGDGADGAVQLRLRGSLESVLRLAAGKCELGGSPGPLLAVLQGLDLPPVKVDLRGRRGTAVAVRAA